MSIPMIYIEDFKSLFHGNMNGKGNTTNIGKAKTVEGKIEADSWVIKAPPSEDDYRLHLEGKQGLGISPINTKNKCVFGVIDIDSYSQDILRYLHIIYKYEMPLVPFYSKSGGLHLYLFFDQETQASDAIDILQVYRQLLGLPKDTEIFPKQRTIPADGVGNWINLPYFDAENADNKRKVIAKDFTLYTFEEGIDYCRRNRRSLEEYLVFLRELPLSDAPPCLQCIYIQGDTIYRNEYLFSLARYFKAKVGDNFEFDITNANNTLERPLDIAELEKSIIRSHKKQEYSYKCGSPPLNILCNKDVCKKRQFGIGSDYISNLSYEAFTQYKSDPPWYEWVVNGMTLTFYYESDIINQQKFRELCVRELHILPMRLVDREWSRIVNKALENITIKDVDKDNSMDTGSRFKEYVTEFMTKRVMAENKEQLQIDRVYMDEGKKAYIFRASALLDFLIDVKKFRDYNSVVIQSKLRSMGAEAIKYYINNDIKNMRCWSLPMESIEAMKTGGVRTMDIDFMDKDDGSQAF